MNRFGFAARALLYPIYHYLRWRQMQKKKEARERKRKSWEAVRKLAAKSRHNDSYDVTSQHSPITTNKAPQRILISMPILHPTLNSEEVAK